VTEYARQQGRDVRPQDGEFVEYPLPPHTYPYRSAVGPRTVRSGRAGMHTDRIVRFDPKTNRTLEYPLPNTPTSRSVWIDEHDVAAHLLDRAAIRAALVKVEPLD